MITLMFGLYKTAVALFGEATASSFSLGALVDHAFESCLRLRMAFGDSKEYIIGVVDSLYERDKLTDEEYKAVYQFVTDLLNKGEKKKTTDKYENLIALASQKDLVEWYLKYSSFAYTKYASELYDIYLNTLSKHEREDLYAEIVDCLRHETPLCISKWLYIG